MREININGHDFRLIDSKTKHADSIRYTDRTMYTNIFGAYDRPSAIKISIWSEWKTWADECGFTIWISSRNGFHFSIGFHGYLENNEVYGLITKTRNEVVLV